jgi:hypothetical protein
LNFKPWVTRVRGQSLASSSPAARQQLASSSHGDPRVGRNIFGGAPPGPAMATLVRAICALGAVSLFTGTTFAFDVVPTTVAVWWPSALESLPQLAAAWGAQHILRQLLHMAWGKGVRLSYLRLRLTGRKDVGLAGGLLPAGYLAGSCRSRVGRSHSSGGCLRLVISSPNVEGKAEGRGRQTLKGRLKGGGAKR